MKGVSAVIATILMLMIVIALAGMAYMYLIGVFTTRTARTIDITDAGCKVGNATWGYYVSIKNLDSTAVITVASDLSGRVDNALATVGQCTSPTIGAGATVNCEFNVGAGASGSFHKVKIIGSANSAEEPANC